MRKRCLLHQDDIWKFPTVPVLLWIYGGSFVSGATAAYPANNIIARSVLRVGLPFLEASSSRTGTGADSPPEADRAI